MHFRHGTKCNYFHFLSLRNATHKCVYFSYGAPATAHIVLGNQKERRELWKTSAGGSTVPFPQAHHTTTQS